jgi:hypothetical protein
MAYYHGIGMMHESLTATDIREICKSRTFPVTDNMTKDTFKNFFLSTVGVEKAISRLSTEEIVFLSMLKNGKEVNVAYFSLLYKEYDEYGTFTQKYLNVYRSIKQNLVRTGLLISYERNSGYKKNSKLERMQFIFPSEFINYLPAPFIKIKESNVLLSKEDDSVLRKKVGGIVNQKLSSTKDNIYIENSTLKYQSTLFNVPALNKWRKEKLKKYIDKQRHSSKVIYISALDKQGTINTTQILIDALVKLNSNQCISADSLSPIFKFIYGDTHTINLEEVLDQMLSLGFLSKVELDGKNHYHYSDSLKKNDILPEDYLSIEEENFIVNLKIPYKALEQLAILCNFTVNKKSLCANLDFPRLVKKYSLLKEEPLLLWFKNRSKAIRDKINDVEKRYGKILLHSNLLLAKVSDFKLKAIFVKKYEGSNKMIFLPNDYIVALQEERKNIEKLVLKSGLAVKIKK